MFKFKRKKRAEEHPSELPKEMKKSLDEMHEEIRVALNRRNREQAQKYLHAYTWENWDALHNAASSTPNPIRTEALKVHFLKYFLNHSEEISAQTYFKNHSTEETKALLEKYWQPYQTLGERDQAALEQEWDNMVAELLERGEMKNRVLHTKISDTLVPETQAARYAAKITYSDGKSAGIIVHAETRQNAWEKLVTSKRMENALFVELSEVLVEDL